ncbi:MAG: hypothetical protein RMY29_013755 [Nostoc sp. CreGUA01]|nr:hypothetical protein [Nostoc sp. CreGUA01]
MGRWGGRGVKEASKRLLFFLIPPSPHLPISPHSLDFSLVRNPGIASHQRPSASFSTKT